MDKNGLIAQVQQRVRQQMDLWRELCGKTKDMSQQNRTRIREYVDTLVSTITPQQLIEAAYVSEDASIHHILQQMSREQQRTRIAALCSQHVQEYNTKIALEDAKIFDLRQQLNPQIEALQHQRREAIRPYPILETHLQDVLNVADFAQSHAIGLRNVSMPESVLARVFKKDDSKNVYREKLNELKRAGINIEKLNDILPIAKTLVSIQEQLQTLYADQIQQEKRIAEEKTALLNARDKVIQEADLAKSEAHILEHTCTQIKTLLVQYPRKWLGHTRSWIPHRLPDMEKLCIEGLNAFENIERQQIELLDSVHVLNAWIQHLQHHDLERSPRFVLMDFQTTLASPLSESQKKCITDIHQEWFASDIDQNIVYINEDPSLSP